MKHTKRFSISPVSAAVALALGLAAPAASYAAGMPGAGTVTLGGGKLAVAGGTKGTNSNSLFTITGLSNGAKITVTTPTVIQWGGVGAPTDTKNSGGFNVLGGNTLNFANTGAPVLNVDASGNVSTIAGAINATGNLFIANANGITVTPGAVISAPVVGLIGANLATTGTRGSATAKGNLIAPTSGPQVLFQTSTTVPVGFASTAGNIVVSGVINNAGGPADILIAGSGSVNVNATGLNYSGKTLSVYGGVGFNFDNTLAKNAAEFGTKTSGIPAANAYAATNVSLTNASPTQVFANGNLTFSGYSTLPISTSKTPMVGWAGVLQNAAGSTLFTPSAIAGSGTKPTANPWYTVKNAVGGGYSQGAVGSIDNEGLLQTVTTGLTTTSNGFTNNGTLRIGTGGTLTVVSGSGDINLGGTVQGATNTPAVANVYLTATKGNINVSAPLTIVGATPTADANFSAMTANGLVNISSAVSVTSNHSDDSRNKSTSTPARWYVQGNGVTISGAQTVVNSNGTNKKQPSATIALNASGQPVNITSTGSITAGDLFIGLGSGTNVAPLGLMATGEVIPLPLTNTRAALTLDGQLTATNTGYATSVNGGDVGSINIAATYLQTSATENMTAQQFNIDVTRWANRYKDRGLFTSNGVLLTSVGANPTFNLALTGNNLQNANFMVNGNITVNANSTTVGFTPGAFLEGMFPAGTNPGNAGTNTVIQASGNLTLGSSSANNGSNGNVAGNTGSYASKVLGDSASGSFWLPGLLYLANVNSATAPTGLGSGSITALHDVYNDYLLPIPGYKGIFFGTNNLTINGSLFTNMNSLVNFTTAAQKAQYAPLVYQVQYSPSNISNTLNVVPNPAATGVYSFNNY